MPTPRPTACLLVGALLLAWPALADPEPSPEASPVRRPGRPTAALHVRVPGLAEGEEALSEATQARLTGAVRTLWAARHEPEALVSVRFTAPAWQLTKVAIAERGRRVCKTAYRLPVQLGLEGGHERHGRLWREEGTDRLSLEVGP